MNRDSQAHPAGRLSGAQVQDQPRLQQQVDQLNKLAFRLSEQLHALHLGLDRIQQRPPQPVDDRAASSAGTPARPSIELALAQHVNDLETLAGSADEALLRLNRMA